MTHKQFIDKWNNKYLERVDSSNLNQCFDLAIAYAMDVLGLPINVFSGLMYAYQIYSNPTKIAGTNFDFIKNQAYAIPKQGDIIVWKKTYNGTAGHVAVVDTADLNYFRAFSQNDPIGSKCHIKAYNYAHVDGWLRKIGTSDNDDLQACLKAHKEAVDSANKKDTEIEKLQAELKKLQDGKGVSQEAFEKMQKNLVDANAEITEKDKTVETLTKQIKDLKAQHEKDLLKAENKYKKDIEDLTNAGFEVEDKLSKVEEDLLDSQKQVQDLLGRLKNHEDNVNFENLYDHCVVELKTEQEYRQKHYIQKAKKTVLASLQDIILQLDSFLK